MTDEERKSVEEFKFSIQFWDDGEPPYRIFAKNIYFTKNNYILYVVDPEDGMPNFYINLLSPRIGNITACGNAKIDYLE